LVTYLTLRLVTRTGKSERTDWYHVRRLDCADVAFALRKFGDSSGTDAGEDTYHVNLDDLACGCSCKGHARHSKCKHFSAVRDAVVRGELS
jgi:hypothetical protein